MPTREYLRYLQSLPLEVKVMTTKLRIDEWIWKYGEENVYVSFSGGKDSTVLLHIVREKYPNVKAVFFDTGLEYPEIREFVKTFDNVDFLKPKQTFREVVIEKGYPLFSKEIAEAIYYARRLTGGDPAECKRNEFEGKRRKETDRQRIRLQGNFLKEDMQKSMFNKEKYLPACRDLPFKIGSACCSVMKKIRQRRINDKRGESL